jgi:hypothetical protein
MKALLFIAALCVATPAMAAEKLLRFDDTNTYFKAAEGKQVDVVFSGDTKVKYFPNADYPGLTVSQLTAKKICFSSSDKGPSVSDPKLKALVSKDKTSLCVNRSDASAKYDAQDVAGAAPQPFFLTDAGNCKSAWFKGDGIGVWWENCKSDEATSQLHFDKKIDGFVLGTDPKNITVIARQFHKKAGDLPDAILPELKAKKLIPNDSECKFEASKDPAAPHFKIYNIMPLGKRLAAYQKEKATGDIPSPPCGELGLAVDTVAYFVIDDRHLDRVVYVSLGQDVSALDPFSISFF